MSHWSVSVVSGRSAVGLDDNDNVLTHSSFTHSSDQAAGPSKAARKRTQLMVSARALLRAALDGWYNV